MISPENLAADIEGWMVSAIPRPWTFWRARGRISCRSSSSRNSGFHSYCENSGFNWTREGGDAIPRILHVKDETGMPIERALLEACRRETRIQWLLETTAVDSHALARLDHPTDRYRPPAAVGAYLLERSTGQVRRFLARETILATGGLGCVYLHTTNPQGSRGDGIAMARRAGARLLNLEYVQFHPTALFHPHGRLLLTEALGGEGARITDASGRPFLARRTRTGSSRRATSWPEPSTSACSSGTSRTCI